MSLNRSFCVCLFIVVCILLSASLGFTQVKKEAEGSFFARIQSVPPGSGFIIAGEKKIMLSPATMILDEKGNPMEKGKLKPRDYVFIEGTYSSNVVHAKKIAIRTPKMQKGTL